MSNVTMRITEIEVVPYNQLWPFWFQEEQDLLARALAGNCIAVYHIGSTSIPNLCAKPKIDIIAVVKFQNNAHAALAKLGYEYRGEFNIPLRHFFRKKQPFNINLHLYEQGNPDIELNLLFRDYLRNSAVVRDEYSALKQKLLEKKESYRKNEHQLTGYNLGKDKFIRNILIKAGYNGLGFRFCSHHFEWESYKRICQEQIFAPLGKIYDSNHPDLFSPDYYYFVLCKGVNIVSIAKLYLADNNVSEIKYITTDEPYKKRGYSSYLTKLIKKWIRTQKSFLYR